MSRAVWLTAFTLGVAILIRFGLLKPDSSNDGDYIYSREAIQLRRTVGFLN